MLRAKANHLAWPRAASHYSSKTLTFVHVQHFYHLQIICQQENVRIESSDWRSFLILSLFGKYNRVNKSSKWILLIFFSALHHPILICTIRLRSQRHFYLCQLPHSQLDLLIDRHCKDFYQYNTSLSFDYRLVFNILD